MTVTIIDNSHAGTTNPQYVNIKGSRGETGEIQCHANFNVYNQDVTCRIGSDVDIGEYECLVWRTGGGDGWDIDKV